MKLSNSLKKRLRPYYHFLLSIGFNPLAFITILNLRLYLSHVYKFKKMGGVISKFYPIISEFNEEAGTAVGHNFHQDLLVASYIFNENPQRHIDIGSRLDGFVAHVASFRKIEVMDIRNLENNHHKNIHFIRNDLMCKDNVSINMADSISCLHAIEHFGLGRYGDSIDPNGHIKGFHNIIRMLKPNGTLYISFPIGNRNEVFFNAHRIFHPKDILGWPNDDFHLKLYRFDYVDDFGSLHLDVNLNTHIFNLLYGCGIYTFKKLSYS